MINNIEDRTNKTHHHHHISNSSSNSSRSSSNSNNSIVVEHQEEVLDVSTAATTAAATTTTATAAVYIGSSPNGTDSDSEWEVVCYKSVLNVCNIIYSYLQDRTLQNAEAAAEIR